MYVQGLLSPKIKESFQLYDFRTPRQKCKIFATISRMRFCANQGMFLIGLTFHFVGKILIALLTLPYGRSFPCLLRPTLGGFP